MSEVGTGPEPRGSARRRELLEAAYGYALGHGLGDLSLRPLAAAIGSSPRVLLFLFGSKDGLVEALLERARADELAVLARVRGAGASGGPRAAAEALWAWLVAPEHHARSPCGSRPTRRRSSSATRRGRGFAARAVRDWLVLLDDVGCADDADRTLLLAVLRGCLLDLLATGDVVRTGSAVRRYLDLIAR